MNRYKTVRNIGILILAFLGLFSLIGFGILGLIFYIACILVPSVYAWNRTDEHGNKRDKGI